MTRYRPTPEADRDLEALADYYTVRVNIDLGLRFIQSAEETFEFLAEHPGVGWRCRWNSAALKGTRVFPVHGFRKLLVFYRADAELLLVVRVLQRRARPREDPRLGLSRRPRYNRRAAMAAAIDGANPKDDVVFRDGELHGKLSVGR